MVGNAEATFDVPVLELICQGVKKIEDFEDWVFEKGTHASPNTYNNLSPS